MTGGTGAFGTVRLLTGRSRNRLRGTQAFSGLGFSVQHYNGTG